MSRPLGEISLSLSGGGTRAAGYHLGVLSYLDRLDLLKDVKVISGASGGAFIVSTYAMSQAKGQSWAEYSIWMLDKLRTGKMAEWVLGEFGQGKPKGLSGRRTIISSLAESYDKHFFEGFRFGQLVEQPPGHLEEVIINATDFRSGLGFRFQRHAPAGNAQTPIDPKDLRHARLADVMASSSCLPGGMEPFFFPEDFVWEGEEAKADAAKIKARIAEKGVEAIPLMDGGLYDNQALEPMMEAAARLVPGGETHDGVDTAVIDAETAWHLGTDTQRFPGEFDLLFQRIASGDMPAEPPGLVIVSDAVAEPNPIYGGGFEARKSPGDKAPLRTRAEPKAGFTRLWMLKVWWWVHILLAAGTVAAVSGSIYLGWTTDGQQQHWFLRLFLHVVPLFLASVAFLALAAGRRAIRHALESVNMILQTEGLRKHETRAPLSTWELLSHLPLTQLPWLLKIRLSSMLTMLSDVYFIRHRIFGYALLYGFPGWRKQLLSVEIYSLSLDPPDDAPAVSDKMRAVGIAAETQPTAFWYNEPDQLPDLVATGQMACCRNLIVYLQRRKTKEGSAFDPRLDALLTQANADWQVFRDEPKKYVPRAARPSMTIAPGVVAAALRA